MKLEKLPSILEKAKFTEKGLVETFGGYIVPAYIASQWGFNERGKEDLEDFYEKLKGINVLPLCPFKACSEYLDFSKQITTKEEEFEFWDDFNKLVGIVNYQTLMPKAKFMIALLDGSQAIDDGVSAEIAYFASTHGAIIGIRSDFRPAENIAAPINPAVRYFLDQGPYSNYLFKGDNAYEKALQGIELLAGRIINDNL